MCATADIYVSKRRRFMDVFIPVDGFVQQKEAKTIRERAKVETLKITTIIIIIELNSS